MHFFNVRRQTPLFLEVIITDLRPQSIFKVKLNDAILRRNSKRLLMGVFVCFPFRAARKNGMIGLSDFFILKRKI